MKYFIPILFILLFSAKSCSAQNEKLNLSEVINSIYFSKEGLDIKEENEKMLFFMSIKKSTRISSLEEVLNLDSFNSQKFQLLYANDEKKILKGLKKVEFGNIIDITKINDDKGRLKFRIEVGMTDYDFFIQNHFKYTYKGDTWEVYYKSVNGKWIIDHIDRV